MSSQRRKGYPYLNANQAGSSGSRPCAGSSGRWVAGRGYCTACRTSPGASSALEVPVHLRGFDPCCLGAGPRRVRVRAPRQQRAADACPFGGGLIAGGLQVLAHGLGGVVPPISRNLATICSWPGKRAEVAIKISPAGCCGYVAAYCCATNPPNDLPSTTGACRPVTSHSSRTSAAHLARFHVAGVPRSLRPCPRWSGTTSWAVPASGASA